MQSTLNSLTQSTQSTSFERSVTAPPHDAPPGTVTFGQLLGNPMVVGVKSSLVPQTRSEPPHALQMPTRIFESAFAIAGCALASGQEPPPFVSTPSSQRASAFDFAMTNFVANLPIARWHLITSPFVLLARLP